MRNKNKFTENAINYANDTELRKKLSSNINTFQSLNKQAQSQYSNIELARDRATFIRKRSIEALDKYLLRFESNFIKNGGKVIWGVDAESANEQILEILSQIDSKDVIQTPSSLSSEINLKRNLENAGYSIHLTGLAERVLNNRNENKPHISHPTIGYNKEDIADALGLEKDISEDSIINDHRELVHNKYGKVKVSISEANFLVSETGSAVLIENEAGGYLATSTSDVHIILAGIESVTASINDLDVFLPLYSTYQSGQILNNYCTIVSGPHAKKEMDGAKEVYVVLIDNGRSDVLAMLEQRDALCSLNTGASALVDPVFKTISGYGYGTLNPGPVSAILEPFKSGVDDNMHLSYASTLSASPSKNSPVKIDINNQLIRNRYFFAKEGYYKDSNKVWAFWAKSMSSRKKLERRKPLKRFYLSNFFKKSWGDSRSFPELAEKSFYQQWVEKYGNDA